MSSCILLARWLLFDSGLVKNTANPFNPRSFASRIRSPAAIYITHDLATVKAISDEIVVMLQGRIVEQGVKKEILTPPHHEYTQLLLSSVPEMDPDWLDNLLEERRKNPETV